MSTEDSFETLAVSRKNSVLFADIDAPPMNLLGPELVRDLVSAIERGFQTREGELDLAHMLDDLFDAVQGRRREAGGNR